MKTTYEALESAFGQCIERNRKGQTLQPCDREALFAHAFFYLHDGGEPEDVSFVPAGLPFEPCWVVTDYKGIAICALIEPLDIPSMPNMPRPDYLWYPSAIRGQRVTTNEEELDEKAAFLIDRALGALQRNHLEEVDSPVQASINKGRIKTQGKASYLPDLPPFVRITRDPAVERDANGGTHASPTPHDRRGHWRTYKRSGKRVWINDCKINGGSPVPRSYRIEA